MRFACGFAQENIDSDAALTGTVSQRESGEGLFSADRTVRLLRCSFLTFGAPIGRLDLEAA